MENSNCGCNCPFVKQGFCETEKECPFYQESWWQLTSEENSTPKLVKDCFPKKMGFQINSLEIRFLALQAAVVETRNQLFKLEDSIRELISKMNSSECEIVQKNVLNIDQNESVKKIE